MSAFTVKIRHNYHRALTSIDLEFDFSSSNAEQALVDAVRWWRKFKKTSGTKLIRLSVHHQGEPPFINSTGDLEPKNVWVWTAEEDAGADRLNAFNDQLSAHADQLLSKPSKSEKLIQTLTKAASLFREYERHHAAGNNMEKAARNGNMADEIEAALREATNEAL